MSTLRWHIIDPNGKIMIDVVPTNSIYIYIHESLLENGS